MQLCPCALRAHTHTHTHIHTHTQATHTHQSDEELEQLRQLLQLTPAEVIAYVLEKKGADVPKLKKLLERPVLGEENR